MYNSEFICFAKEDLKHLSPSFRDTLSQYSKSAEITIKNQREQAGEIPSTRKFFIIDESHPYIEEIKEFVKSQDMKVGAKSSEDFINDTKDKIEKGEVKSYNDGLGEDEEEDS